MGKLRMTFTVEYKPVNSGNLKEAAKNDEDLGLDMVDILMNEAKYGNELKYRVKVEPV